MYGAFLLHRNDRSGKMSMKKDTYKRFVQLTTGAFLMAVSVTTYFNPLELVTGGVTGLSVVARHVFGLPMWLVNIICNVPLFIIGYKVLGRVNFYRTLYATVCLTVFLGVVPRFGLLTGDVLVDGLCGGVIMGGGLGLIFLQNASSGGADMLAQILNRRLPHISVPKMMAVIDGVIILFGFGVFGLQKGIYSLIALFVMTRVSDRILEGPNHAKLMYIISTEEKQVKEYIIGELGRGVTEIPAKGGYTGSPKRMLLCALSSKEMVNVKRKIYEVDDRAICFVGDVREAYGEGFTKIG